MLSFVLWNVDLVVQFYGNLTPLRGVRECICMACSTGLASSIMSSVQGHSGPVTSLAALRLSDGNTLLASTAAEENVLIWECPPGISSAASPHNDAASSPPQPLPCSSPGASHSKEAGSKPQPASGPHQGCPSGRWSSWRLAQTIPWGVQLQHSAALTQLPGRPNWCEVRCASYVAPALASCLHNTRLQACMWRVYGLESRGVRPAGSCWHWEVWTTAYGSS